MNGVLKSLLETGFPIAWLAAVVRNGQYSDAVVHFEIDDVVREASDRHGSHWQVGRHARHRGSGTRQVEDPIDGFIHSIEELEAEVLSPGFVPSTGKAVLDIRLVFKLNARIHRFRSSASARRRTSSHGTPADSPAITLRARLSISAAHAASTSAGFSVSASSRLARSSAATSARSATGNVRASRRSSCARDVTNPFRLGLSTPQAATPPDGCLLFPRVSRRR